MKKTISLFFILNVIVINCCVIMSYVSVCQDNGADLYWNSTPKNHARKREVKNMIDEGVEKFEKEHGVAQSVEYKCEYIDYLGFRYDIYIKNEDYSNMYCYVYENKEDGFYLCDDMSESSYIEAKKTVKDDYGFITDNSIYSLRYSQCYNAFEDYYYQVGKWKEVTV